MGKKLRSLQRAARNRRVIKHIEATEALEKARGRPLRALDVKELQVEAAQEALRRMVELELARWIDTMLTILRDTFGFSQEQIAQFAKEFRSKTSGQTAVSRSLQSDD